MISLSYLKKVMKSSSLMAKRFFYQNKKQRLKDIKKEKLQDKAQWLRLTKNILHDL
jgi:hypothetical protein